MTVSSPVTPDSVYQLIKSYEAQFPIPAPYYTVDVGTFDTGAGTFKGLTTTVERDPEPVPHGPHDHPRNPPPHFAGERYLSVTIDASWRRTVTSTPAPKVPLAPVLLKFSVSSATSPWSVTAGGVTVSAGAGQTSLTVDIWDADHASWSIQASGKSFQDNLRIQRPAGALGGAVGAFTIPVLPVAIVYAPPVDSGGQSTATYTQGQTVGTTLKWSWGTDSSSDAPAPDTAYSDASTFTSLLGLLGQALSKVPATSGLGAAIGAITDQIGQISTTEVTGISDLTELQMTVSQTTSEALSTSTSAGGPGVGDVVHCYRDLRMAWVYYAGRLRLYPLGYHEAAFPAVALQKDLATIGLSAQDAQNLLALDPFVGGSSQATLPADRFQFDRFLDYGYGVTAALKESTTRDTTSLTTEKSYTTTTNEWQPGPILKFLGFGSKDQTTISASNAVGSDVSSTVSMEGSLVAGPNDYFSIAIWYDTLFGTFAFQQLTPTSAPRFQGTGAQPLADVKLVAGDRVFWTVADKSGSFQFRNPALPAGPASLTIANGTPRTVTIGQ